MGGENISAFEKRMLQAYNPHYAFDCYCRKLRGEDKKHRKSRYIRANIRKAVNERDRGFCVYCGSDRNTAIHHIKPRAEGGTDYIENLVTLCYSCHMKQHKEEHIYHLMRSRMQEYAIESE